MLTKIWDFFFHRHQWEIYEEGEVTATIHGRKLIQGKIYIMKCSKCGDLKSKRIDCSYV